jgi:hypothetical protein
VFFTPNLVIGVTIMAVGVALLLDTLGIRDIGSVLKYWPALIVLFGMSIVAQAFRPVDPAAPKRAQSGVSCFFLFLLAVAMFSTFGCPFGTETRAAGRRATATSVMGNSETRVTADTRSGRVAALMGKSSLDLRQVNLKPGDVMTVDVFVTMGRATIRIPDEWVVDASALPVMGSVDEARFPPASFEQNTTPPAGPDGAAVDDSKGDQAKTSEPAIARPPATGPPPRLRLRGFVMMGKVEVRS